MTGAWGRGRRRKMGFDGSAPSPRKRVTDRMTVAGVEYTAGELTGWTCSICRALTDLEGMVHHAKVHRPEEVARAAALARLTAALGQLDADALGIVLDVLPAVVANPAGFAELARALVSGERKHPGRGLGPSPDQSVDDHLAALDRHAERAPDLGVGLAIGGLAIDADTRLSHAGLAAARAVLAIQRAAQGSDGQ